MENDGRLILDSSQAKCFSSCKRRYFYNHVECLRKNEYEEDSVDLRFGGAIHSALEKLNEKTVDIEPIVEVFRESFVDLPGEDVKTNENGCKLLRAFLPYYRANFGGWETLEVEQTSSMDIGGIDYKVKIDRVIRWNGNVYVVDWKTTKSTNKRNFFNKFTLDFQPSGYIKWCKDKYGECGGFIPVVMYMSFRKRKYLDNPAGFSCDFDYTIVNRADEDIREWEKDMLAISDEIEQAKVTNVWRRNPEHCTSYRGCQYRELCESNGDSMVKETLYSTYNANEYLGEI